MLYLQYENRNQEIHFYINSPGGSVTSTLAIYDTMQFLECPIATYCMGMAASGAAILLAAGTKGKRFALPHSKVMIHQPWSRRHRRPGVRRRDRDEGDPQGEDVASTRSWPSTPAGRWSRSRPETERNRYFTAAGGQGVRPGR